MRGDTYKLVTFGLGGHTMYAATVRNTHGSISSRLEGYDDPVQFEADLPRKYLDATVEGAILIDLWPVLARPDRIACVLQAPLVDVDRTDTAIERFAELNKGSALPDLVRAGHLGQTFAGLLALADAADAPGPLDTVSLPAFVAYWRRKGARIGYIDANRRVCWPAAKTNTEAACPSA